MRPQSASTSMSSGWNRIFNTVPHAAQLPAKSATVSGATCSGGVFRDFGRGPSAAAAARKAVANHRRPASASTAQRRVENRMGGSSAPAPTLQVTVKNTSASSTVRPKVSRRIPDPSPSQFNDYLGAHRQQNAAQKISLHGNERSFTERNSVPPGVRTTQVHTVHGGSNGYRHESRSVTSTSWKGPTYKVEIDNRHHDTSKAGAGIDGSQRQRPKSSRRISAPDIHQFTDYNVEQPPRAASTYRNMRATARSGSSGDRDATVMLMTEAGPRATEKPIITEYRSRSSQRATVLPRGGGERGGDSEESLYTRSRLSERFERVDEMSHREVLAQQRAHRRSESDKSTALSKNSTRRGNVRHDPQHFDSTLVSRVKIEAMRRMRGNGTNSTEDFRGSRVPQGNSLTPSNPWGDAYAPRFSESKEFQATSGARVEDNVLQEGWFATDHKFAESRPQWNSSVKLSDNLRESLHRSTIQKVPRGRSRERRNHESRRDRSMRIADADEMDERHGRGRSVSPYRRRSRRSRSRSSSSDSRRSRSRSPSPFSSPRDRRESGRRRRRDPSPEDRSSQYRRGRRSRAHSRSRSRSRSPSPSSASPRDSGAGWHRHASHHHGSRSGVRVSKLWSTDWSSRGQHLRNTGNCESDLRHYSMGQDMLFTRDDAREYSNLAWTAPALSRYRAWPSGPTGW